MWVNLLLAVLTVFLILLVYMNLTSIMSHRHKENAPKPAMLLFTSALIGIGLMLSGLYFSGYLFIY